jgi:hypothetical protein
MGVRKPTWDEDVLEPGERRIDINRRRADEGSADHDGTPDEAVADWNCGDRRRHATSDVVVAIPSLGALVVRT